MKKTYIVPIVEVGDTILDEIISMSLVVDPTQEGEEAYVSEDRNFWEEWTEDDIIGL